MKINQKSGFIKMVILIIIAIAVLSWYGINLDQISAFVVSIWNKFLATPAKFLWTTWVEHIWVPFMNSVSTVKK
jgi:hypothetical protein